MSETYPIVLLQDRYRGTYSGGAWLAIANASDLLDEKTTRAQFCLVGDDGPSDSDVEAARFWRSPPNWIAVGRTPVEAIEALQKGTPDPRVRTWRLGIKFEESTDK